MFPRMYVALVVSAILTLSVAQPTRAQTASTVTVSGTVSYQQRLALPENTVVTVRLVDVSRADAPATVIAEQQIPANGKSSPIPFSMDVESSKIEERNSYAVQAAISTYGKDTFRSTARYLVLTQGQLTTADIVVTPVSSELPNTSGNTVLPLLVALLLLGAGAIALGRRSLRNV